MRKQILHLTLLLTSACFLQGCIHEYPLEGASGGKGEDPTAVEGYIQLNYDLNYEDLLHNIDFSTKAPSSGTHRFIVEIRNGSETIVHDVAYTDDTEFSTGTFRRKLSSTLKTGRYEISAWYDRVDSDGEPYFKADRLDHIEQNSFSTTDTLAFQCAFATDILDLREYAGGSKTVQVTKELEMKIPGARFQLVATDVQTFIAQQKEALNQGDKFTVWLDLANRDRSDFNAFSGSPLLSDKKPDYSGWMRLPFAEYDELTIAQGFIFCNEEDNAIMTLSVKNSALFTVSKTNQFTFPVKRGYNTIVKGDFLTRPVDGILNVDNIWAGEIYYDI